MRKKSLGIKKRLEKVMRIKADVWGCIRSQRMRWERRIPSAVSRRLGASVKRTRAALNVKKRNSFFHPSQSNVKEKHLRKNPSARGGPEELTPLHSGPGPREGPPQKLLNSSYFFIQSICGAFFFSLAWIFIFSSAAVALRPISAKGSIIRLPSSSAS